MDFFAHQEKARRKTWLLIFYFLMAVVLIILTLDLAIALSWYVVLMITALKRSLLVVPPFTEYISIWMTSPVSWFIIGTILFVIIFQSIWRWLQLREAVEYIAEMVDARSIDPGTEDAEERKLISVVQEMSIASGIPVPDLYVMDDEDSINAFVAGLKPTQTIMVFTRGALDKLTRHELQGVVGHEFSHILNGDMRMNVRLIGILSGILFIGKTGLFLLYHCPERADERVTWLFISLGFVFIVIGYVGVFWGRLIKAAISRQREFLADSSAVQLTKDRSGIAGALYKIKKDELGSELENSGTEEVSHMCFSESVIVNLNKLLSTHPPLDVRIRRVYPSFRPSKQDTQTNIETNSPAGLEEQTMGFANGNASLAATQNVIPQSNTIETTPQHVKDSVGNPNAAHLDYATALHSAIPAAMLTEMGTREGARGVIYALLLPELSPENAEDAKVAVKIIREKEPRNLSTLALKWAKKIHAIGPRIRLPLIDLVMPSLKKMPYPDRKPFLETIDKLIQVDNEVSLFEYILKTILSQHLDYKARRGISLKYNDFKPILAEAGLIISMVAHTGGEGDADKVQSAYTKTLQKITSESIPQTALADCTPEQLQAALTQLAMLYPPLKKTFIDACTDCVLDDGVVEVNEIEILRAISERLDCPMPPLVV